MRLAIIPARGGSKRIPRKNVRPFAGKPMIAYAIEAARTSGLFERLVVSTDDEEIAQVARAQGAEVPFTRPPDLADDHTPTVPVVAHAIRACAELGWAADAVCCIYPGVPFIEVDDLRAALAMLDADAARYVFPIAAYASPIQRALRRGGDGRLAPFDPANESVRTQDLEPAYHDAGQFYWGKTAAWIEGLTVHANGAGLVLPAWRVVDIDTPEDWERAELLFETLRRSR